MSEEAEESEQHWPDSTLNQLMMNRAKEMDLHKYVKESRIRIISVHCYSIMNTSYCVMVSKLE